MWKLLPVCLLVACAANDPHPSASDGNTPAQERIVRQFVMPLETSTTAIPGQPSRKNFQRQGMQGWLDDTGAWHIRGEIQHGRLRCATYATGIQLGRGGQDCSNPEWLTDVEYTTSLMHCNGATRLHEGGGNFPAADNRLAEVNCVRVLVRCEGAC
jgi:hypothetical protein